MRLVTRYIGSRSTVIVARRTTYRSRRQCCSPAGSTARCCSPTSAQHGRGRGPIYVSVGLAWEDAEARDASTAARRAAVRRARRSRSSTLAVDMRDVYPADALGDPRRAAGLRHAGRGRLSRRPQHRAAREGGGLLRAADDRARSCSARSPAIRFPTRRRSSSTRWRARCRSGSAHADRDRGAVRDAAQGGRHPARRRRSACRSS